jgi:2,3-bisphosphoglycerate-dependent phosphoglycerate mutase
LGKRVLVVVHGNSLSALIKHLERISDADVPALNVPIAYHIGENGAAHKRRYIGDPDAIRRAVEAAHRSAQV